MAKTERIREIIETLPSDDQLRLRAREGWRLVAVEWERTVEPVEREWGELTEEIPYGLRVAADCRRLEEDPVEKQVLVLLLEGIVRESSCSEMAGELNQKGYTTREGAPWSDISVFRLMPRLIEVGSRIFSSREWSRKRRRLFRASEAPGRS